MSCSKPRMRAIVVLRLYISLNVLLTALIFVGRRIDATAVMTDTTFGNFVLTGMFILSSIALYDSIVNDVLPDPYSSHITEQWRVLGFMGLAILMGSVGYLLITTSGKTFILLRVLVDAGASTVTAFLGLREVMYNHRAIQDRRHSNI